MLYAPGDGPAAVGAYALPKPKSTLAAVVAGSVVGGLVVVGLMVGWGMWVKTTAAKLAAQKAAEGAYHPVDDDLSLATAAAPSAAPPSGAAAPPAPPPKSAAGID